MTQALNRPDLILVRHGHSEGNAGKRTHGVATIALTDDGHRQAQALATQIEERYGRESISRILTTPYDRTRQTAMPLIVSTGLEPVLMPDMREITYLQSSKADGSTYDERTVLRDEFWAATRSDPYYVDEGEEDLDSAQSFVDRVRASLELLGEYATHDQRIQVVYSHEFPISTALNIAKGKSDEAIIAAMAESQKPSPRIENTQAIGLTFRDGKWAVVDDSHEDLFPNSRANVD